MTAGNRFIFRLTLTLICPHFLFVISFARSSFLPMMDHVNDGAGSTRISGVEVLTLTLTLIGFLELRFLACTRSTMIVTK